METRRFGGTGLCLSLVGIGSIPFMRVGEDDVSRIILKGLDCGVNFIETARGYRTSEAKIGKAIKGKRDKFILITKGHAKMPDAGVSPLDESLKALGVDYVDVYQVHGLRPGQLEKIRGAGYLDYLLKAKEQGRVRTLGVTSHQPEALEEAVEADIFTSIQAPINFVEYDRYRTVLAQALKKDIGILAMKPLGGGVFPARESLRFLKFTPVSAITVGVENEAEVAENVEAVSDERPLSEKEKNRLEKELKKWGDKFCRKCGYCTGCPEGIPTSDLMLTEILYNRDGAEAVIGWGYIEKLEMVEKCAECGECVKKCPYSLRIPRTIREYRDRYLPLLKKLKQSSDLVDKG